MENQRKGTDASSSSSASDSIWYDATSGNYVFSYVMNEYQTVCEHRLPCGWCKLLYKKCDAPKMIERKSTPLNVPSIPHWETTATWNWDTHPYLEWPETTYARQRGKQ